MHECYVLHAHVEHLINIPIFEDCSTNPFQLAIDSSTFWPVKCISASTCCTYCMCTWIITCVEHPTRKRGEDGDQRTNTTLCTCVRIAVDVFTCLSAGLLEDILSDRSRRDWNGCRLSPLPVSSSPAPSACSPPSASKASFHGNGLLRFYACAVSGVKILKNSEWSRDTVRFLEKLREGAKHGLDMCAVKHAAATSGGPSAILQPSYMYACVSFFW